MFNLLWKIGLHIFAPQRMSKLQEAKKVKEDLRTPKGTVDFHPRESKLLQEIMKKCESVFKVHGGRNLDTPTFELLPILSNKSEEENLIFELKDQGGDICGLRFDLTVPLARYLAQNRVLSLRRYQIGKVFRRDQPAITKGRYREFYQCDFDICGKFLPLLPDAETVVIGSKILRSFNIGKFVIKINHRKLITAICLSCLDPNEEIEDISVLDRKFSPICSAIDKLDKIGIKKVKEEIIQKGWKESQADQIAESLVLKTLEDVEKYFSLTTDCQTNLEENMTTGKMAKLLAKEAISDLRVFLGYLKTFGELDSTRFEISLARGLNYYTGIIFEAVFENYADVGSVLGGGRYDNLVGQFCNAQVPAVGFSVGILRIFSILSRKSANLKTCSTKVLLVPRNAKFMDRSLQFINKLWSENIPSEINAKKRTDISEMKKYALKEGIENIVLIGDEINEEKALFITKEGENLVTLNEIIEHLKN